MRKLLKNIRFYILLSSLIGSILITVVIKLIIPDGILQTVRLTQFFGFVSLGIFYFALLCGPFCFVFKNFPYKDEYKFSRRALGVSSFYFALLHSCFGFFGQLGGLVGIPFLGETYLWALIPGFIALLVFSLLAATSFDIAIKKMTFLRWKLLHRLIYLGGILAIAHTFLIGSHFNNFSSFFSQISVALFILLLILETIRLNIFLQRKWRRYPAKKIAGVVSIILILLFGLVVFGPLKQSTVGIHSHPQGDCVVHTNDSATHLHQKIPYNVLFNHPEAKKGQNVKLNFEVVNSCDQTPTTIYPSLWERSYQLIIIDDSGNFFQHLYSADVGANFSTSTVFPHDGTYHLYFSFVPPSQKEQTISYFLKVGDGLGPPANQDLNLVSTVGNLKISLNQPALFKASQLQLGQTKISFSVTNLSSNKPITNLKPYLTSFGYLTIIQKDTFDSLQTKSAIYIPSTVTTTGGPTLDFYTQNLTGLVRPGSYYLFLEIIPDKEPILAKFLVKVE